MKYFMLPQIFTHDEAEPDSFENYEKISAATLQ